MKVYVCLWRIIVILNAASLISGILLAMAAGYLLTSYSFYIYFLFQAEEGDAFFDTYLNMTIAAIFSGFVAGVGVSLGVTPHRCISVGFVILAAIGILLIGIALSHFYSVREDIQPEYVNISTMFDDKLLGTMRGLSNLHFLQNYFECCGLHGPDFYSVPHGSHLLRKRKKKKKVTTTTTTTTTPEPEIPVDFDYTMEKLPFSCCGLYYFNLQCTPKVSFIRGCMETAQEFVIYDDTLVEILALTIFASEIVVIVLVLFIVITYKFAPVVKRERFSSENK